MVECPTTSPANATIATSQPGPPRSSTSTITKPSKSEINPKPTWSMNAELAECRNPWASAARHTMYPPRAIKPMKTIRDATSNDDQSTATATATNTSSATSDHTYTPT